MCLREHDTDNYGTERLLFQCTQVPSTMYDGCHPYRDREIQSSQWSIKYRTNPHTDGNVKMSIYKCVLHVIAVTYIETKKSVKPIIKSLKQKHRSIGQIHTQIVVVCKHHGPTHIETEKYYNQ